MSSYNGSQFIGFAACFPKVLPRWLYTRLFCPTMPTSDGMALAAPAGLRRIEAALVAAGIPKGEIAIADPDHLSDLVGPETRAIGVTSSDPMGLGPASSTFSNLIREETYTAHFFRKLMSDPAMRRGKARVIVGGPGAWQLAPEATRTAFGIDCLVEGEGEDVAPDLFMRAIAGQALPRTASGGAVMIDRIPPLLGPTINGIVEISRGCGRGCEFCSPNMRLVRHFPQERILSEVRTNLEFAPKITLHAEDVLRYGAKSMTPDGEKVAGLFEACARLTDRLGMSHIALSSALAEPRLVEDISHALGADSGRKRVYAQTGIETGSPQLVSRHMKGKAKPFAPERWPEVVTESFKLLQDNGWSVCGTLVMGMPGETREDVERTIDLVRNLRPYRNLIVPLFFVPMGGMKDDGWFTPDDMLPEHWMLFAECVDHDFRWVPVLMDELFSQNRLSPAKARLLRLAAWYMQRRLRPYLEMMREGRSPLAAADEETEDHPGGGQRERARA